MDSSCENRQMSNLQAAFKSKLSKPKKKKTNNYFCGLEIHFHLVWVVHLYLGKGWEVRAHVYMSCDG